MKHANKIDLEELKVFLDDKEELAEEEIDAETEEFYEGKIAMIDQIREWMGQNYEENAGRRAFDYHQGLDWLKKHHRSLAESLNYEITGKCRLALVKKGQ